MISYFGITGCAVTNAQIQFKISRLLRTFKADKNIAKIGESRLRSASIAALLVVATSLAYMPHPVSDAELPAKVVREAARPKADLSERRTEDKKEKVRQGYIKYITNTYKVAPRAVVQILSYVESASEKFKIPASLILAVIAKESKFNPFAYSTASAEGLMQMIPKYHPEKMDQIGGVDHIIEIEGSIASGTKALSDTIHRCGGDITCGLQTYNGNAEDVEAGYANRVLAERKNFDRLGSLR